jgi:hypothetical protein
MRHEQSSVWRALLIERKGLMKLENQKAPGFLSLFLIVLTSGFNPQVPVAPATHPLPLAHRHEAAQPGEQGRDGQPHESIIFILHLKFC